jgi:hypothetical protein
VGLVAAPTTAAMVSRLLEEFFIFIIYLFCVLVEDRVLEISVIGFIVYFFFFTSISFIF